MTKRTIGILLFGSAVAAWLWSRQRSIQDRSTRPMSERDRGTVIFDNTPTAMGGGIY